MDKGLLFKLSYINRISMPVYRGRTALTRAEIEVCTLVSFFCLTSLSPSRVVASARLGRCIFYVHTERELRKQVLERNDHAKSCADQSRLFVDGNNKGLAESILYPVLRRKTATALLLQTNRTQHRVTCTMYWMKKEILDTFSLILNIPMKHWVTCTMYSNDSTPFPSLLTTQRSTG